MSPTLSKKPKVIFCDLDNTITTEDVWYFLTSSLHADIEKHYQLYTDFSKKKISFEEMKKGLFEIWNKGNGGPVHKRVLQDIFFKAVLRGEAFAVFSELRNRGYRLCIISSYMDMFVELVAQRLQLEDWYANTQFVFDENDHWIDYTQDTDEGHFKLQKLEEFLSKNSIEKNECLVLGGGYEEMELFRHYPGVAVNTHYEPLLELAWKEIKYLPTLLQVLNQFE